MALIRTGDVFEREAQSRLAAFREDLPGLTTMEMLRKHVLDTDSCVLTAAGKTAVFDSFYKYWGLDPEALVLVGSSVTGFSLDPDNPFRLFDFNESDIDVAITDATFFADTWGEIHSTFRTTKTGISMGRLQNTC